MCVCLWNVIHADVASVHKAGGDTMLLPTMKYYTHICKEFLNHSHMYPHESKVVFS